MSGLPHVWHLREVVSRDTGLNFLIGRTLSLYLMGTWSRALIAVSRSVARMFTFGPTRRIMHVVYNGIDLPPGGAPNYPATVHAATKSEQPVLILVGLLQPEKGQTEAIRALSELSRRGYRCQLRLVGADTFGYGARLHALCDELRVDEQVIFTGHLSDPLDEIMRADVVLNCSPSEGFGRVTVEAMLLGKPVIGTNTGGTPEIIKDGRTGLLYRQGDPVHLADRIAELLANPTQAAEMGPSARQAAQSRFSVEQYVDGVEAIYRRILANETVFAE
jgi:glycosyltransferase involved in cell wall biosynthesis